MPNVQVKLGPDPDNAARKIFRILVKSEAVPGAGCSADIDPGKAKDEKHLRALVSAAGSSCAEWLNQHKGDRLNEPQCGLMAVDGMERELLIVAELASTVEVKMAQLKNAPMGGRDREIFHALDWKVRRGIYLLPAEVEWVDGMLVEVRRAGR